jgi:multiple sugar transport system permease protein
MATSFAAHWRQRRQQRERWRDLSPLRKREAMIGLAFISPWIIGVIVFSLGPFIVSLWLSFTRYTIIEPPRWIGLDNYRQILYGDDLFFISLRNTATYVVGAVAIRIVLGFALAMLLNARVRFLGVWRTLFYIPSIVPIVATSMIWLYVLNGRAGLLNWFLSFFGVDRIRWLSDPEFAMTGLLLMSTTWVGVTMIIFLAGLQNIPEEYYEAAKIDGAGGLTRLLRITIPLMTPTIYLNILVNIINTFQVFSQVLIMTDGGPRNATRTFVLHIYDNAFTYLPPQMGYASALAWILFMIVFVFTAFIVVTSNRWVFYNG